ncbi:hypothetical protein J2S78_002587 [Salibacterium salarium]|nr:hypothetical protein [Salibacterium salarium]
MKVLIKGKQGFIMKQFFKTVKDIIIEASELQKQANEGIDKNKL